MRRAKVFLWLSAALALSAARAPAQTPLAQSPSVPKARACLKQFYQAGVKARMESDFDKGEVAVLNPMRDELLPLLAGVSACMEDAYPKREIVTNPKTNAPSRVWYDSAEGQYVWCATSILEDKAEQIGVLGGPGAARDWFAIIVSCAAGEKILGFYTPQAAR
jgi:hypothetical protein